MPYNWRQYRETAQKKLQKIWEYVYTQVGDLALTAYVTKEPVPFSEKTSGKKKEVRRGDVWGELWDCAWIRCTGRIPAEAKGKRTIALLDIHGEACLFDEAGNPLQGLTPGSTAFEPHLGSPAKKEVLLADSALGGETIDFWLEAGCNDLFGVFPRLGEVEAAAIVLCRQEVKELYYDWKFLLDMVNELPEEAVQRQKILCCFAKASAVLQTYSDEEIAQARTILKTELSRKNGDAPLSVSAIGHAHIDLAWLWPIRETVRKGARTFSTALYWLERDPDYIFGASQPQLYQWMKTYYPGLYQRVAEQIAVGRWEAQGAMWVEADTNVSGGEALVRQILYGKRFFRQEFGKEMEVLWLPDVFGYSGALPQLLKKSNTPYFMTIKLSWSRHNKHPHHTFLWQGIDGSEVLVHMPPEGEYNSFGAPRSLCKIEKQYIDKGVCDEALMLFGIGDGGGGPGEEHLANLKREKNFYGLPPVKQEPSVNFFHRLEKNRAAYPTFKGELYLEKHQGTYTTQGRNKRYNRKMELLLREIEFASVVFGSLPGKELEEIWKEVLLYQFHDILPGSSIQRVYDESLARYAVLYERCTALLEERYTAGNYVMNSLSWARREWIKKEDQWYAVTIPPMGSAALSDGMPSVPEKREDTAILENDCVRVTLDSNGAVASIFDKQAGRELLNAPSNRFAVYTDEGDGWDFDEEYRRQKPRYFVLQSTAYTVDGPLQMMEQTYAFGASSLRQEISILDGSALVRFAVTVDWKESEKMLRAAFYTGMQTDRVSGDIQFGHIQRSVLENTMQELAQYEICAHKFIDLSEEDYGVALLSESKYGFYAKHGVMDINLLRSSHYPGKDADVAEHTFAYAFYPHAGNLAHSDVVEQSYAFNIPVHFVDRLVPSFVTLSSPNVVVETVKPAEDGDGVVLRLYECRGVFCETALKFAKPVRAAYITNLLEEEEQPADLSQLAFHPFEIHTLKIYF